MSDQKVMGEGMLEHFDSNRKLKTIFDYQHEFGKKFCDFELCSHDPEYKLHWAHIFSDCIMNEISEVQDWTPWKHWKDYSDFELKPLELKFELVDILHFAVSLCLVADISPLEAADRICDRLEFPLKTGAGQELEEIIASFKYKFDTPENKDHATRFHLREINYHVGQLQLCYNPGYIAGLAIDILQANIHLMYIWGMDAQEIFDMYMSKNKENFARQERGY